jgi:parallel beta-helix repeat protein
MKWIELTSIIKCEKCNIRLTNIDISGDIMEKRYFTLIIIVMLLTGMLVSIGQIQRVKANTITVPDDYLTIQGAINAASAGDTIYVKAGVYVENVIVNKSLTMLGESKYTTIVDGNGTGNVIYVTTNNVTISGFTARGSGTSSWHAGIRFYNRDFCTVVDNICEDCRDGIRLMYCDHGQIQNNNVLGRVSSTCGIAGYVTTHFLIENNTVSNTLNAIRWDESDYVQIIGNALFDSREAICWAGYTRYADVLNNTMRNCSVGITCGNGCENCVIYHNSFINNSVNFLDNGIIPTESFTWDDGYPSGGNYWSDYVGLDHCRGFLQDEIGSDGIGDTSCIIDENNEDRYPLLAPWELHDTAILNVATSKDGCTPMPIVCQSFAARVNITTTNRGTSPRTFNVTAYANDTLIGKAEVSVAAGFSHTTTFLWNTSSFAKGNYTIKTVGDTVAGDTTPADNNLTGGTVQVVMIGDVLPTDNYVGIDDIYAIASRFGLEIGNPGFSPNLDITDDDYVGIDDLYTTASHFGEEEP